MLKNKQMSMVVHYQLEINKSRNFLGIQISKLIFFLLVIAKLFTKCYAKFEKSPLLQSPYYVSPEVLMSNNYKVFFVLLFTNTNYRQRLQNTLKKCFSNLMCIQITWRACQNVDSDSVGLNGALRA